MSEGCGFESQHRKPDIFRMYLLLKFEKTKKRPGMAHLKNKLKHTPRPDPLKKICNVKLLMTLAPVDRIQTNSPFKH